MFLNFILILPRITMPCLSLNQVRIKDTYIRNKGCCFCNLKDILVHKEYTFDFNVFLPSLGKNLQRPLVWTDLQKEQFILSYLKGIYIPPYAVVMNRAAKVIEVIDGKQRLTTLIAFVQGEFGVTVEGVTYYFNNLDREAQNLLLSRDLEGNIAYIRETEGITDAQKVEWFRFINFAGTPADLEHLKQLKGN